MHRIPHTPLLLLLAGCACAERGTPLGRAEAEAVLHAQAACWNRGDLEAFVATYVASDHLTFLGSQGLTRGRRDLLANYSTRYPDAAARGRLSFEILEFRALGPDRALLLGHYHLQRTAPDSGFFSLVLVRVKGEVKILHDHTSRAGT